MITKNTNLTENVTVETKRETQTYAFERYGNNFTEPVQALNEIIWNAFGDGNATEVWVEYDAETHILRVINNGTPANIHNVFQYGRSSGKNQNHYYGTGMTNASAYFNPSNNCFYFITKNGDVFVAIMAPFCEMMSVGYASEELKESILNVSEDAITCYTVWDENGYLEDANLMERLGKEYGLLIQGGKKIYINGEPVKARVPDMDSFADWTVYNKSSKHGNYRIEYKQVDVSEFDPNFAKNMATQGAYLYFNGLFVQRMGVTRFQRESGNGHLKEHNMYNGMRTLINIVTEGVDNPLKVPFNNTKTGIAWNKAEGKELNATIDELCGERYRARHVHETEAGMRKAMDYIMKTCYSIIPDVHYEIEKGFCDVRCDGVLYQGAQFSPENIKNGSCKVLGIMEYKRSSVTSVNVGQVMAYLAGIVATQPKNQRAPEVLLIGKNIKKETKNIIKGFQSFNDTIVIKQLAIDALEKFLIDD